MPEPNVNPGDNPNPEQVNPPANPSPEAGSIVPPLDDQGVVEMQYKLKEYEKRIQDYESNPGYKEYMQLENYLSEHPDIKAQVVKVLRGESLSQEPVNIDDPSQRKIQEISDTVKSLVDKQSQAERNALLDRQGKEWMSEYEKLSDKFPSLKDPLVLKAVKHDYIFSPKHFTMFDLVKPYIGRGQVIPTKTIKEKTNAPVVQPKGGNGMGEIQKEPPKELAGKDMREYLHKKYSI